MKYIIYCLFIITLFISGCKKENTNVPETSVDIYMYTNNPSFVNVSIVGGWAYISGGIRGILLYRKSNSEFMAYDRNCTYQSADACATIYVDNTNIQATDTCCHSRFSIYDGSVYQGPAALPLKAYRTTFDGNVLHVFN